MSPAPELSPPPRSVGLFKVGQITDAGPYCDHFDISDLIKDFKFHSSSVSDALLCRFQDGSKAQ